MHRLFGCAVRLRLTCDLFCTPSEAVRGCAPLVFIFRLSGPVVWQLGTMRVHHVAFRTADLPRLEAFYRDVLRLPILRRHASRSVWLKAGETILMLEVRAEREPPLAPGTGELVAFAIEAGEARAFEQRLEAASVAIEARTASTLYFRDPDGRRIALSAYPDPIIAP